MNGLVLSFWREQFFEIQQKKNDARAGEYEIQQAEINDQLIASRENFCKKPISKPDVGINQRSSQKEKRLAKPSVPKEKRRATEQNWQKRPSLPQLNHRKKASDAENMHREIKVGVREMPFPALPRRDHRGSRDHRPEHDSGVHQILAAEIVVRQKRFGGHRNSDPRSQPGDCQTQHPAMIKSVRHREKNERRQQSRQPVPRAKNLVLKLPVAQHDDQREAAEQQNVVEKRRGWLGFAEIEGTAVLPSVPKTADAQCTDGCNQNRMSDGVDVFVNQDAETRVEQHDSEPKQGLEFPMQ